MIKKALNVKKIESRLSVWSAGCRVLYRKETASTNDWAIEDLKKGAEVPAVYVTDLQTKGKGRRGRTWDSKEGENITFSILVRPGLPPDRFCVLTPLMGLSTAEELRSICNVDAVIKWPNDILINSKKVCGILSEAVLSEGAVVIGTGINISKRKWPDGLSDIATTIEDEAGTIPCREEIIAGIVNRFSGYLDRVYTDKDLRGIHEKYEKLLTRIGERIIVDGREYKELGADELGRLTVIDLLSGDRENLSSGEIEL